MKTSLCKSFALSAIIFCALLGLSLPTAAHDFSSDCTSGQTLFYNITNATNHTVSVTYPYEDNFYANYPSPQGALTIPATVTYNGTVYSVTSIGNFAFNWCSGLTSVTIPNSVTSIGSDAFNSCRGLSSVTIPNSVTSIGSSAFSQCYGLISVTIPNSVISIGSSAFSQCYGLISVTIPNSVTSIGDNAFWFCSSLTSVTIPNSVISIGNFAFSGCSGLTSVTIPNSVTSIGDYAFTGCSGLTSVTIPNSVTSIGNGTFCNCYGLTSVTIPNSVISIGNYAFHNCSGLTSVTFGTSVASIGNNAFSNCIAILNVTSNAPIAPILDGNEVFSGFDTMTPLLIPTGSRDTYVARNWGLYFDIREQSSIVRTSAADYTIGTDDMRIVVRGAEGQRIRIYDNLGRLLSNTQSEEGVRVFVMSATGIYMVQVGNDPAHKVVLIR